MRRYGKHVCLNSILLGCLFFASSDGNAQDKWDVANSQVKRLSPSSFSELPRPVVRYLQLKHCTIPQLWYEPNPHNVIRGMFVRNGQYDWAVLCSRNRISSILIFWNGSIRNLSQIAKAADKVYLQTVGDRDNGGVGFSRIISVVGRKYILDHYKEYGGPKPPPINHQGINDAYAEKASMVLYYHGRYYGRRWLELAGAD